MIIVVDWFVDVVVGIVWFFMELWVRVVDHV